MLFRSVIGKDAAVSFANNSGTIGGKSFTIRYLIVYAKGAPDEGYKGWREAAAEVTIVAPPAPPKSPDAPAAR